MIELLRAPAYATVQDGGREGHRSSGVPRGGAMDLLSLFAGNALLGNEPGAAAIEWALTGGTIRFGAAASFVLTGARADARFNESPVEHGRVLRAAKGDVLTIERIISGRFLYLCFRGGLDLPLVLGGRGTYLPAAFGGLEGRRLASGDVLTTYAATASEPVPRMLAPELRVLDMSGPLGLMRGPQADALSPEEWRTLCANRLVVTAQSDRMGYRLSGLEITHVRTASEKSGPSCSGAVQLTPAGELIVLMADGPTAAGYPKIGVVAAAHLPRLAQAAAGEQVRFQMMEVADAVALLAAQRSAVARLARDESGDHTLDSRS